MIASDMVILCLDTTTSNMQMGLTRGAELIARVNAPCDSHRYHSALMIPAIDDMLKGAALTAKDLTALAVNAGPGSFTGIRTGIITARTMAQFLELPVYLFNHFELLAVGAEAPTAVYLDALRGRAYHTVLSFGGSAPVYHAPLGLSQLDGDGGFRASPVLEGLQYLVSPSLASFFSDKATRLIAPDFFTPAAMMSLIGRYGDLYAKKWREVRPLYLQEPSITLRKTSPVAG